MIKEFEDTGSFVMKSGRMMKSISSTALEDAATALQEKTNSGIHSNSGVTVE